MKRLVGAALFGVGVLLAGFAIGLPTYVAPAVSQLPYDLDKSTSVAEASGAQFLQIKSGVATVESGALRTTVEVLPRARQTRDKMTGKLEGKAVVWEVYQAVRRIDNEELINAYSTELALDRRSGAAAPWDGAWLKDGTDLPPDYSGQVYKFPFNTEKKSYLVYDRDLRRSLPAEFKEETTINGVRAYRFEQVVPEQQVHVAEANVKLLLSQFAPGATSGQVVYRTTRTFWIEPVTGLYLDFRDQPHKELRPNVGSPTVLLDADFRYTKETVTSSSNRAAENAQKISLVTFWLPVILGVLGLIAIVVGLLLVLRGPRDGAARHRQPEPDQTPVGARAGTAGAADRDTAVLPAVGSDPDDRPPSR